jgi:hypothetical protein
MEGSSRLMAEAAPVSNFFNEVGYLCKEGGLPYEAVWKKFGFSIRGYALLLQQTKEISSPHWRRSSLQELRSIVSVTPSAT